MVVPEHPKESIGPYRVPAFGWLVLRASRLHIMEERMRVLESEALGFTHDEAAPLLKMTGDSVRSRSSRAHQQLFARSAAHAVRIAHAADLLDVGSLLELSTNPEPQSPLSGIQTPMLTYASMGLTRAQMARVLGCSSTKVGRAAADLYDTLGVRSMPQAVMVGCDLGILEPPSEEYLETFTRYFW